MTYEEFYNENNQLKGLTVRLDNEQLNQLEIFEDNFYCPFASASEQSDELITIEHEKCELFSDEEEETLIKMIDKIIDIIDEQEFDIMQEELFG